MGLPSHVHGENGIHFQLLRNIALPIPNKRIPVTDLASGKVRYVMLKVSPNFTGTGRLLFVPFTNSKKSGLPIVRCIPESLRFKKLAW